MLLITLKETQLFLFFALFLIVSLIIFISNPDSSFYFTIFIISSIFLSEIINSVAPDPYIFISIAASVADSVANNPNSIKMLLAKRVSTIFTNSKLLVINGLRNFYNPSSWLVVFIVVLDSSFVVYF